MSLRDREIQRSIETLDDHWKEFGSAGFAHGQRMYPASTSGPVQSTPASNPPPKEPLP